MSDVPGVDRSEVMAESRLRARSQCPELRHREHAPAAADTLAAVEDRTSRAEQVRDPDRNRQRQRNEQEERREDDVERPQLEVDAPPVRGLLGEPREPLGKAVMALHSQGH